jgi:PilZ domain
VIWPTGRKNGHDGVLCGFPGQIWRAQTMLNSSNKKATGGGRAAKKWAKPRAVRRCPFVASVEVTELGSKTRLSARTSEMGAGGCYVDALNPFAIGTEVQLRVTRDQGSFEAKAKVVYCDPSFGMGLEFTEVAPEQRLVLENWLAEIVIQLKPMAQ